MIHWLEEIEIDQALYPSIPQIPKGDVLFLINTGLIHEEDLEQLREFDKILNDLFTNGELYENNKKWIARQKRITPAERLLSVIINICVQKQRWGWVTIKEINQFIASRSTLFPTQLRDHQYKYLAGKDYLKYVPYAEEIFEVALQPKIAEILKPENIIFPVYP